MDATKERSGATSLERCISLRIPWAFHASTLIGVALTALGVIILVFALINFLQNRRSIDMEQYHSSAGFAIVLTLLASVIGGLLAVYLLFSA